MAVRSKPFILAILVTSFLPSYAKLFPRKPSDSGLHPRTPIDIWPPIPNLVIPSTSPAAHTAVMSSTSSMMVLNTTTLSPATKTSTFSPTTTQPSADSSTVGSTPSSGSPVASASNSTTMMKRAAIPACLNTVELSCLNLAANCIDSVNGNNLDNVWAIDSCAVAGTCYGVGALIDSIDCQTGFGLSNADEGALDYNIYASAVGSCAFATGGCPMTQQNYIDWYYGVLTAINTANFPSSANVVIAFYNTVKTWTATGSTIPYKNLNDWYHFSSFSSPAVTVITQSPGFTTVAWNPNPAPSLGALSETFFKSGTTVIVAVPTVTTTVVVVGVTITLAPGGTPIAGNIPTDITQPNAITPTFNYNPVIPPTASSATFVSGTWTSIVAVPTSSNSPVTVTGPPNDGDDDSSDNSWLIIFGLFGPVISGTLPTSVSVIGGVLPAPVPPPGWPDTGSGSWTPPPPPILPGGNPDDPDDPDDTDPASCPFRDLPPFYPPYDPSGEEPDDPDAPLERRDLTFSLYSNSTNAAMSHIFKRATRHIVLGVCADSQAFNSVNLGAATWYTVNPANVVPAIASAGTTLYQTEGAVHTSGDGKVKEHIFELRYIKDFVNANFAAGDCTWLRTNMWNNQIGGVAVAVLLSQAIDNVANLAWVADEINKAKSYVVNNQKASANDPPLNDKITGITSLDPAVSSASALQIETLIRALGVVGEYFTENSAQYTASALRVQNILAQITPSSPIFPPLDTRWNNFVRNTVSTYSNGITSRAANTLNAYRNRLNGLLQVAQAQQPPPNPPPSVPSCWPVFHDATIAARLADGGINWLNFVPPALAHPPCNTAGTLGSLILSRDANNNPAFMAGNPPHQLVALGNQFYGLSIGPGTVYYDFDLVPVYGNACNGIHFVNSGAAGQDIPIATWDQNCHGTNGKGLSDLSFHSGGQQLPCFFNNFNDGSFGFIILCGASQPLVQTCIGAINARQPQGAPNAQTTVPFLQFSAI